MTLFKKQKAVGFFQVLIRYAAEVVIIFIGITISFLFEQWREDNRQKQELIELSESLLRDADALKAQLSNDLQGSARWITEFDSLRVQRTTKKISETHLVWLYKLINGQEIFLFNPQSPAYLAATNSGLLDKLPDSIQNHIYKLYHVELRFFQLLYDQQQNDIAHFRNSVMVPSESYLYASDGSSPQLDLQKFSQAVQRPAYGNFINQIRIMETEVYQLNERASISLTKLINSLTNYRNAVKT